MSGTLYLVSTPIGNLGDMTFRAVETLKNVDFIACEDTRNSGKLLSYFEISKPLISYFEHNKVERGPKIVERLLNGESCALITDAGTPGISDPGEDLVKLCAEAGVTVTAIPGCVASIDALILSGISTRYFAFEGFLPKDKKERKERLALLKNETRTLMLHESPHHLKITLQDLADTLGTERKISLCRELTKLHEEIMRTTIGEAISYYEENEPRGEYVLVLEGSDGTVDIPVAKKELSIEEQVEEYISQGLSEKDAIKQTAKERGLQKNVVYILVKGK